ncbi:MAG: hypothetical protein OXI87_05295 [Albidovulum sp.]|nr:hypothetical protein [Albidovulum sp.]MDE0304285.1 hypothetical protein [Albidovulum sp.]MDE0531572.1 hypothetical protein [Albidovulum sp.]
MPGSAASISLKPWQCVIVAWGDKYDAKDISRIVVSVRRHASIEPRIVLVTDRIRPNVPECVLTAKIPKFFLDPVLRGSGCQTKLAIFESGVVPDDLPAIYVDLDTMVLGDLGELTEMLDNPETVAILQSAVVPIGAVGRAVWKLSKGRRFARGNSSIVVFHPGKCGYIAKKFRELHARHSGIGIRPMIADDRFISWVAQENLRSVSRRFGVKFRTEFMLPWLWLAKVRSSLPWVRTRRDNLKAITFPGTSTKPEQLLSLSDGEIVKDYKNRKFIWSDAHLGATKQKIVEYYSAR